MPKRACSRKPVTRLCPHLCLRQGSERHSSVTAEIARIAATAAVIAAVAVAIRVTAAGAVAVAVATVAAVEIRP